jgi:hypothetical protein
MLATLDRLASAPAIEAAAARPLTLNAARRAWMVPEPILLDV